MRNNATTARNKPPGLTAVSTLLSTYPKYSQSQGQKRQGDHRLVIPLRTSIRNQIILYACGESLDGFRVAVMVTIR